MFFQPSAQQIYAAAFGGYGKTEGELYGELLDRGFPALCPPAPSVNTTIVAVCGPNDYNGNAGPKQDGWFFSDFYLFHHLFKGTAKTQHWLSCVDPKTLISKYRSLRAGILILQIGR